MTTDRDLLAEAERKRLSIHYAPHAVTRIGDPTGCGRSIHIGTLITNRLEYVTCRRCTRTLAQDRPK